MKKYIGIYKICVAKDLTTGKQSKNPYDNYIICKNKNQIFRYSKNILALYLVTTNSKSKILPQLKNANIKYEVYIEGDFEGIYLIKESDLPTLVSIVKPLVHSKNKYPNFED